MKPEPRTNNSLTLKTYASQLAKKASTDPRYKGYQDSKGNLRDPLSGMSKHRKLLEKHQQFHFGHSNPKIS